MDCSRLGQEVAVGLLAGPEDLLRVRQARSAGLLAEVWRRMEARVEVALQDGPWGSPVADLACAAAVSRRPDWAEAALQSALRYAEEPYWGEREVGVLALRGMHRAFDLCLAVDWLWPVLDADQRGFLLETLLAKAVESLLPVPEDVPPSPDDRGQLLLARRMDRRDPHCLHPHDWQLNNWDMWFSGALYMAACLADRAWLRPPAGEAPLPWARHFPPGYELDAARVARWQAIARERIGGVLANQIGPEGDYAEGLAYAGYGGRALVTTLMVLARCGGEDLFSPELLRMPGWVRAQFVAGPTEGAANFNDCRIGQRMDPGVLAILASRSGDPAAQGVVLEALEASEHADHLLLLGLDPDLPASPVSLPPAAVYSRTGEVLWRGDGVFFAAQCGAHGGAHQHRDRGGFFLSAYGEHLAVDSGDCRYTEPTASPPAGDTRGHNCLLVDGRGQWGDNYEHPVSGRLLEHAHEVDLSTALADATACYEGLALVRRRFVFLRPDVLVVADRVEGSAERLTFLLQGYNPDGHASWSFGEGKAVLTRPGARLHVVFLEPVAEFSVHAGTLDGGQNGLLRLEAEFAGRAVTAVLVPARAEEPAPVFTREAGGSLRVSFRGREWVMGREGALVRLDGSAWGC